MARYDLGLSDEEFGDMTYALFEALIKRKEQEDRSQYIHTGILAASVINYSMCHPDKPAQVVDFIPGEKERANDLTKMNPGEQAAHIMSQFSKRSFNR